MNSSLLLADMNGFAPLAPTIEALGWTLLHFVWQGTALALALACFLAMSRRTSPRMRYAAGCAALMLMCLGAVATFAWQVAACNVRHIQQPAPERIVAVLPRVDSPLGKEPGETASIPVPSFPIERDSSERSRPAQNPSGEVEASAAPIARITLSGLPTEPIWEPLRPWLSWMVGLWAGGVGFLALRLAAGWRVIRRLHAQGKQPKDPVWSARLDRLRVRLGVSQPVRLLSSASATVPMVIGWLRPVVLVPAGLLTGLSVAQLEAVFAHELAHIRRHDYLVNLLQNVIETLFFYYPAVWWASQQVRSEREHCCDDLAAATCGGPLDYARALTALAELRHTSGALGLAATGGSLVGRMRRLAGIDAPGPRLGWPLPALVLAVGAVTALFVGNGSSRSDEAHNAALPINKPGRSICGRLLDPLGKPVANATLWLTAEDGKTFLDRAPIVASAQSTPDGRFELKPDPPALQQIAGWDRPYFSIWIRKPGLGLTYHPEWDGWPAHPIEIPMRTEEPASMLIHNPDGSPCANATVAPLTMRGGSEWSVTIPEIVRKQLTVHSAPDGRADLLGMNDGTTTGLRFETPDLGVQCCEFPSSDWPVSGPAKIALRKTGSLAGRLIPPAGCVPDFSRVQLRVTATFKPNDIEKTPWSVDLQFGLHDKGRWSEDLTIRPDRDGRFVVPKIAKGLITIVADVPDNLGYRTDRPDGDRVIIPGQTTTVEIPMWKRVQVIRTVRDAQTKKPLSGVPVVLEWKDDSVKSETDAQGTSAAWIRADVPYQISIDLPQGYVRRNAASFQPVLVPSAGPQRKLEPIELSRECRLQGVVVDPQGQPLAGVGADWRVPDEAPEHKPAEGVQARKWAITDSEGRFQFEHLVAGAELTLTPVRAGVVLADPLRVEPGNDKPIRLQTRQFDFAAIEGRVIDRAGKPFASVEVVVRVVRSNASVNAWHVRTDPSGRFQTPAYFPKQLEYQVTVRPMCKDLISSVPRHLSQSREQFPELVIDRPEPFQFSKLVGTDVIAIVNGEPIFASDVFERASLVPLEPAQMTLVAAAKELEAGRITESDYSALQDEAIRRYLPDFVKTRVLAQALLDSLEKEQKQQFEEQASKMFEECAGRLKQEFPILFPGQLNEELARQGTSLNSLRKEFRLKLLAEEYLRSMRTALHASREAMEAYYQKHLQDYSYPEQVRWQLLEVSVRRHNGRKNARAVVEQAAADLRRGEDFASIVGKYSDGPGFEDGPDPLWTRLDNRADQELSAAMRKLAAGDVKPVFDDRASIEFRVGPQQGSNNALNLMQEGAKRLRKRESSEKVVRKYYADGGKQPWTNPASLADPKIAAALSQLAPGQISPVLESRDSFRLVRLMERMPAGCASFNDVAPSIRGTIEDQLLQQMLDDLYRQSTIESPYLPDGPSKNVHNAAPGAAKIGQSPNRFGA